MKKIVEAGVITNGGKMRLPMNRINEFFDKNKGKRLIITFEVAEHGSSEALQGYYFKYIVPTIQQALWKTGDRRRTAEVQDWLLNISPVCEGITDIHKLSNADMIEHIEWLKQFAAENLDVYIEEPRSI